jgi:hypothetical protein
MCLKWVRTLVDCRGSLAAVERRRAQEKWSESREDSQMEAFVLLSDGGNLFFSSTTCAETPLENGFDENR